MRLPSFWFAFQEEKASCFRQMTHHRIQCTMGGKRVRIIEDEMGLICAWEREHVSVKEFPGRVNIGVGRLGDQSWKEIAACSPNQSSRVNGHTHQYWGSSPRKARDTLTFTSTWLDETIGAEEEQETFAGKLVKWFRNLFRGPRVPSKQNKGSFNNCIVLFTLLSLRWVVSIIDHRFWGFTFTRNS